VQTAGEAVTAVGELAAGVQPGEDQLHSGNALFGMNIHRHPAAVVDHGQGTIFMQNHLDGAGVTGDGLVHAVIDDFLRQVIGTAGIGVHPRTPAHRIESAEHFDGGGVVHVVHWHAGSSVRLKNRAILTGTAIFCSLSLDFSLIPTSW
jgi:hypothetical protein